MAIVFDKKDRTISIHTDNSTYQMKVDRLGYLLHLYYGAQTDEKKEHLIEYADRGFSGNPYDVRKKPPEDTSDHSGARSSSDPISTDLNSALQLSETAADPDTTRSLDAPTGRTYSLDALPQEFPFLGSGDYRSTLLVVKDAAGVPGCDLRYVSHRITDGKYSLPGLPAVYSESEDDEAQTLEVILRGANPDIEVRLLYGVLPKIDIITRSAVIKNLSAEKHDTDKASKGDPEQASVNEDALFIEKAQSACLDFTEGEYDRIIFHGRHTMERIPDRQSVGHGSYIIGSRRGFSSHQYNPFIILTEHGEYECEQAADDSCGQGQNTRKTSETSHGFSGTTEDLGQCWSMQFVYSGSFKAEIEKDQYGQTRMQMGLMDEGFCWKLEPGKELVLPEVIMSYSGEGLAKLSDNHHRCIREHVCRGYWRDRTRPLLLNSWEACYFDFTGEKICQMAEQAKSLGLDMIVMDDGWFGRRDDDLRALGDWYPNESKLGCTLKELGARIHGMGLRFGIWMEPEMVSEDSDLYREHPDWALRVPGRPPVLSRDQLVLDLSRDDVADAMYKMICAVIEEGQVDYLKWDANRHIYDIYSNTGVHPGELLYRYVLGLYRILEQLNQRFPNLLIEGCCGGGGRYDAGMLYYTPQIWCSDNTDPLDRVMIQYGTSFGYPVCTAGAHVSASPNDVTGRETALSTRTAVAMAGTFGYELDPSKLTEQEKAQIRKDVGTYKKDEELIRKGRYFRLSDPITDGFGAWEFVSQDRERALLSVVITDSAKLSQKPRSAHDSKSSPDPKDSSVPVGPKTICRVVSPESAEEWTDRRGSMGAGHPVREGGMGAGHPVREDSMGAGHPVREDIRRAGFRIEMKGLLQKACYEIEETGEIIRPEEMQEEERREIGFCIGSGIDVSNGFGIDLSRFSIDVSQFMDEQSECPACMIHLKLAEGKG